MRKKEGGRKSDREAAFAGNATDKACSGEINTLQIRLCSSCTGLTLLTHRRDFNHRHRFINPCEIMSRSAQIQPAR